MKKTFPKNSKLTQKADNRLPRPYLNLYLLRNTGVHYVLRILTSEFQLQIFSLQTQLNTTAAFSKSCLIVACEIFGQSYAVVSKLFTI